MSLTCQDGLVIENEGVPRPCIAQFVEGPQRGVKKHIRNASEVNGDDDRPEVRQKILDPAGVVSYESDDPTSAEQEGSISVSLLVSTWNHDGDVTMI